MNKPHPSKDDVGTIPVKVIKVRYQKGKIRIRYEELQSHNQFTITYPQEPLFIIDNNDNY